MSAFNYPMVILLCTILVLYVTMVYGPIAAWLVELFPAHIRYTLHVAARITSAMAGLAASCQSPRSPSSRPPAISTTACGIRSWWRAITIVIGGLFLRETKDSPA